MVRDDRGDLDLGIRADLPACMRVESVRASEKDRLTFHKQRLDRL